MLPVVSRTKATSTRGAGVVRATAGDAASRVKDRARIDIEAPPGPCYSRDGGPIPPVPRKPVIESTERATNHHPTP